MEYKPLTPQYDAALAKLIRSILKDNHLDIPGTAYYDEALDHMSSYYDEPGRAYYVLLEGDTLAGGIGIAGFDGIEGCCELQKLYLADSARGSGTGYEMVGFIEDKARELSYKRIYLETHTNLEAAIHIYERSGYKRIDRPESVIHSTMNRFYLKEL
ncbi:MAG: GNAT family N-acetyltransferase [Lachnospiraceae bacterium]|nr:GNAT family N-acetyltransferase [Lachnospiraceae bacterium]